MSQEREGSGFPIGSKTEVRSKSAPPELRGVGNIREIDRIEGLFKELLRSIESKKHLDTALDMRINKIDKEIDEYRSQIAELEKEESSISRRMQELTGESMQKKNKIFQMENKQSENSRQFSILEGNVKSKEEEVSELNVQLEQRRQELGEFGAKVEEGRKRLVELKQSLSDMQEGFLSNENVNIVSDIKKKEEVRYYIKRYQ